MKNNEIINALLFGDPPYTRYFAPEPEVFVELLPLLGNELLEEAFYLYQLGVIDENQYVLLFERLKPFFPKESHEDEEIQNNWQSELHLRFPKPKTSEELSLTNIVESVKATYDPNESLQILEYNNISQNASEEDKLALRKLIEKNIVIILHNACSEVAQRWNSELPRNTLHRIMRLSTRLSVNAQAEINNHLFNYLKKHFSERLLIELYPILHLQLKSDLVEVVNFYNYTWILELNTKIKDWEIESFYPYQSPIYKYLGKEAREHLETIYHQERLIILQYCINKLWGQYGGSFPLEETVVGAGAEEEKPRSSGLPLSFRFEYTTTSVSDLIRALEEDLTGRLQPEPSVVNIGFSKLDNPAISLNRNSTLEESTEYYFLVKIGEETEWTIDESYSPLPSDLPVDSILKVALFSFDNELELTPGEDVGWIILNPTDDSRSSIVKKTASIPKLEDTQLIYKILFFKIKTPKKNGSYRLRCNVYYKQVLLQSRIVKVKVTTKSQIASEPVLESLIDYDIGPTLNLKNLNHMHQQDLSIMLNNNDDGTHSLRVFGDEDVKFEASLDNLTLKGMIRSSRETYRKVSWGNKKPWKTGNRYRYEKKPSARILKADLVRLAKMGYNLYCALLGIIDDNVNEYIKNLRNKRNYIEFIIKDDKETANYIIPIALIYDQKLDDTQDLELCSTFLQAYETNIPLDSTPCFQGNCPEKHNLTTICPSGFWGFRNIVGLPIRRTSEIDFLQTYDETPKFGICAAQSFKEWPKHKKTLEKMVPSESLRIETERNDALDLLQEARHLFYFYCHGDLVDGIPYLRLGDATNTRISPSNFTDAYDIEWEKPKPLIIINGCHTTALNPEKILNFVNPLLRTCHAAGVIGTEITIFESLATRFAEECIQRFLNKEAIGEAVRKTRVSMLEEGNPLGLVYIPYVHNGLQLIKNT